MPSYLLKVTKFLGKIFQFEFLVMTEKRIFPFKLFLSLNISDFNLFHATSACLKSPLLSQQPPPKAEVLPNTPFMKIRLEAQLPTPLAERRGVPAILIQGQPEMKPLFPSCDTHRPSLYYSKTSKRKLKKDYVISSGTGKNRTSRQ